MSVHSVLPEPGLTGTGDEESFVVFNRRGLCAPYASPLANSTKLLLTLAQITQSSDYSSKVCETTLGLLVLARALE